MATLADLFKTCYLTSGNGVEFASAVFRRFGVPSPDIEALRNG